MDSTVLLAALSAVPELGPVTIRRLIDALGSPEAVFSASYDALRSVEGVSEKRARSIREFRGTEAVGRSIGLLRERGIKVLVAEDAGYPGEIRDLGADAPLVLFIKGEIIEEDRFAVAVVGSRKATGYGRAVAERLGRELAEAGLTVVSGGALGVDTSAHVGAIGARGRTIAVLGSGIDVPYPAANKGLFERMARDGAVVSEFMPGTPPGRENFPRRNRLISGLSMGVVVVEAAGRSGALITARTALEQGKEVFAVPGNISSETSIGTNDLIRQGARVVTCAGDIVEELAPRLKGDIERIASARAAKAAMSAAGPDQALPEGAGGADGAKEKGSDAGPLGGLGAAERTVLGIMSGGEPMHVDEIARAGGLPVERLLGVLLGLEVKGIVRQAEGKRYSVVRTWQKG